MEQTNKTADFYMGANSAKGFYTYYNELEHPKDGWRSYLIKGGAGTGKSSLMKRIGEECGKNESLIEHLHCSSDPNSLDGIVLHDKKASIVDATPPHVIEPTYPGGYQSVINLCEYFDEDKLASRIKKTIEYQTKNNECHRKCCNLLNCANILLQDNYRFVSSQTDFKKILSLANRIIKKEFKNIHGTKAEEHKRLLSAITNQGIKTYSNTPNVLAENIYIIKDIYGVASHTLLSYIREVALQRNFTIYTCFCPLNPDSKIEHLFIPELKLGFITQTKFNNFINIKPVSVISFTRFTNMTALRNKKQFLSFNKKAAGELINEAISVLKYAKSIHDDLERQYTDAVDFDKVAQKSEEIIAKIKVRNDIHF
ncbi:hypothetical protein RBG61_06995 [Paludicola sp. MB14-C6]|uniref:hypothetical protein n=1 Tax=Paludihabitans sp. MB14-C6 TaxID=3070656 RepID=UPI0027DE573F|nr:hypothetical protein [Paludicola sp. MB14-C6]WMJ24405.1 hypothetical protein RBG61_06995 [Paludicola sp. MB14-C6]